MDSHKLYNISDYEAFSSFLANLNEPKSRLEFMLFQNYLWTYVQMTPNSKLSNLIHEKMLNNFDAIFLTSDQIFNLFQELVQYQKTMKHSDKQYYLQYLLTFVNSETMKKYGFIPQSFDQKAFF